MVNDPGRTSYSRARGVNLYAYRNLMAKSRSSVDSDSNWMITMSDIMSLLLVFFIMFFIISKNTVTPEQVHIASKAPLALNRGVLPEGDGFGEGIKERISAGLEGLNLGDDVSVQTGNSEIVVTMKERVTYNPGEAEILERSGPVLDNIAAIIREHASFLVEIDGHTDNVPIQTGRYPSNWELSVARAASVLKYFINEHDISPSRFAIRGYADQRPVAPNHTAETRAQNRRVEIRLKQMEG